MSEDDYEERPAFGGLGQSAHHDAGSGWGPGWGSQHNSDRNGTEDGDDNDAPYPPRKRPKFESGNGTRARPAPADSSTGSGRKMTFAQRQMAKMGWTEGQGLGAEGKGRLAPIEVVQRPTGAGVGTVREKTKQVKDEERRAREMKGEVVEDSSEEERRKKKASRQKKRDAQAGQHSVPRTQLRKPKYVSAEDLEADLQNSGVPRSLLEFAIDLSGNQIAGQQSGTISGFASSRDAGVPEEKTDSRAKRIQRELVSCAESKHGLNAQRATLTDLETHLVGNLDRQKEEQQAAEQLLLAAREIQQFSPADYETDTELWEAITRKLEHIQEIHEKEQDSSAVQEIAIGAIHPVFRSSMATWDPLAKPKYLVHFLKRLKPILSIKASSHSREVNGTDIEPYQSHPKRSADYYETMIYSLWLPRVSSVARSDFQVERPEALVKLVKAWKSLIPDRVHTNLMNQEIIPRILTALKTWRPSRSGTRKGDTPDVWIFPWLELLPTYQLDVSSANSLISDVKRKLRKLISSHPLEEGIPKYLTPWRELLGSAYSHILTSHLLPRLAAYMSQHFTIDPADQDMKPIETILTYAPLFPNDSMARLLVAEFFPKFHNILYQWLIMPTVNYDEVTEWWTWWKAQIPPELRDHSILQPEWTNALNKIGRALDLGPRAAEELEPPEVLQRAPKTISSRTDKSASSNQAPQTTASPQQVDTAPQRELTFRDIISDWCEEHDLLCVPTREAHTGTGEPIIRITASADQRGGVLAYARGDVLYVRSKKDRSIWIPTELGAELEKRASER